MVRCKMGYCPYFDVRGLCGKELLAIDENGMCEVLWRGGQQKKLNGPPFAEELYPKKENLLFDADFEVITKEKENEE